MTTHSTGAHTMQHTPAPTAREARRLGQWITGITWALIGSVIYVSVSEAAPFLAEHTRGDHTPIVLALSVDAAFVLSLQADSLLGQYGVSGDRWATLFRWVTGALSIFMNAAGSVLAKDTVSTITHVMAPALLLLIAEAGPGYRRRVAALRQGDDTAVSTQPPAQTPAVSTETVSALPAALSKTSAPVSNDHSDRERPVRRDATKMGADDATAAVKEFWAAGRPQRAAAAHTGWSAGWVAKQYGALNEKHRQQEEPERPALTLAR